MHELNYHLKKINLKTDLNTQIQWVDDHSVHPSPLSTGGGGGGGGGGEAGGGGRASYKMF